MAQQQPDKILPYRLDSYNGVLIESRPLEEMDELQFGKMLQASITRWGKDERRGLWLKIPIKKATFVPIAVELGFVFHDCKKDMLVLTKWLPNSPNKLPLAPTHTIGVGGFVVNENREVLVVREKNGPASSIWKIPGGLLDPGEYIPEAVMREVLEETGIQTQFLGILNVRHHHTAQFGNSDLYWTCLLKPLTNAITKQEDEIADAKWMPLDEFLALDYYKGLYRAMLQMGRHATDGNYVPWTAQQLPVVFQKGTNYLYHGCKANL